MHRQKVFNSRTGRDAASMKASILCAVNYEGVEAHQHEGWPCPPTMFDPAIGQTSFDRFLGYARLADDLGFDWISVSEHHFSPHILAPSLAALAGAVSHVQCGQRIVLLCSRALVT